MESQGLAQSRRDVKAVEAGRSLMGVAGATRILRARSARPLPVPVAASPAGSAAGCSCPVPAAPSSRPARRPTGAGAGAGAGNRTWRWSSGTAALFLLDRLDGRADTVLGQHPAFLG